MFRKHLWSPGPCHRGLAASCHAAGGSRSPTAAPTTLNQASRYRSGHSASRFPMPPAPAAAQASTLLPAPPPLPAASPPPTSAGQPPSGAMDALNPEPSAPPGSSSAIRSAVRQGCTPNQGVPSSGCGCRCRDAHHVERQSRFGSCAGLCYAVHRRCGGQRSGAAVGNRTGWQVDRVTWFNSCGDGVLLYSKLHSRYWGLGTLRS